jgi:hypothetical protein
MSKCNDEVYQLAVFTMFVTRGSKNSLFFFFSFFLSDFLSVGKKIKDKKERVFDSASYKQYIRKA